MLDGDTIAPGAGKPPFGVMVLGAKGDAPDEPSEELPKLGAGKLEPSAAVC